MVERGGTPEQVNNWAARGKVVEQARRSRWFFVTQEGAAVVDKFGHLVITYSASCFGDKMQEIIKILF